MFDNIGEKIKTLAKVICWFGIISSCMTALVTIIATEGESFFSSVLIAAVGSLISWVSSFFTYGFGELIENSSIIATNTYKKVSTADPAPNKAVAPAHAPTPKPAAPVATSNDQALPSRPTVNEDGGWTCPQCSRRNLANRATCWSCGYQK